jgi:hypothetical protein
MMHRLIMNTPKGMDTDHINGDSLDNRRCNLRICTHAQNQRNLKKILGNNKYKGVSLFKKTQKWRARIQINRMGLHLGYFDTEEEAAKAYNEAAEKHFGEFSRINII